MPQSDERTRARLDRLEQEARHHPRRHAWRLGALALLGYAYPALLSLLSFGLVLLVLSAAPLAWQSTSDPRVLLVYLALLLGSLVLTAAVLRTFYVALPVPDGHPLPADQAAPLRALVEEVRQAAGGPPIHEILISTDFNAAVTQRPRFGFWGRRTNYLMLGLPLLMVLKPEQLRAVLAHELGHLSGRHSGFGAWIYRIHRTWESLAAPFGAAGRLRWLVMGWFVHWYGAHFAVSTLALRRLHEYEADRASAEVAGKKSAGRTLLAIDWIGYRLGKSFWPAMIHEAASQPLPPSDLLGRMREFLAGEPNPQTVERWRGRVLKSRTPVTHEHPCLLDRLAAVGCRELLDEKGDDLLGASRLDAQHSSLTLLGEGQDRIWATANASWKAIIIQRWRMEHAAAKQLREKLAADSATETEPLSADQQWERLQIEIDQAHPDRAPEMLRQFLDRFPQHAPAHFALGRLLLNQDDEQAVEHLDSAIRHGSDYIAPALETLLDYYREAGRDPEADPIRRRIEAHQRELAQAKRERLTVRRHDRFLPHGLDATALEELRRLLYRYPQVQSAYLARKQVRLFTDKPSYVLAITRRASLLDSGGEAEKHLRDSLTAQLQWPCAIVVLGWRSSRLRAHLLQACPTPIFQAAD